MAGKRHIAAAAVALATALAVPASAPALVVGVGDQKADMFTDPLFSAIGVKHARIAIAWDALSHDWQAAEVDRWMRGAQAAGVEPLVGFMHARGERRRVLPSPSRLKYEFRRFRQLYPWVRNFAVWNEVNHCGEPTCNRPRLVASYYKAMRKECPSCTVVAAELLDMPNVTSWVRRFRVALGYTPPVFALHNYVEANRFTSRRLAALLRATPGADLWLTETGGLVKRRNNSRTDIPEGRNHATLVTRYLFDRVAPRFPRIKRIYIYHWNARKKVSSWDSALVAYNDRPRPSLAVLQRVMTKGLRPSTTPAKAPAGTKRPPKD